MASTTTTTPTADQATWGTRKSIGNPEQAWVFGGDRRSGPVGEPVLMTGRWLAADGGSAGTATRYWAVPVTTNQATTTAPVEVDQDVTDRALIESVHPGLLAKLETTTEVEETTTTPTANPEVRQLAVAVEMANDLLRELDQAPDADAEVLLATQYLSILKDVAAQVADRRASAIRAAYMQGTSYSELARTVGLSPTRVQSIAAGKGK